MATSRYLPFGYNKGDEFKSHILNNVSVLTDGVNVRSIKYLNVEIVKLISFLVRDKNWKNYTPKISNQKLSFNKKFLELKFNLEYSDKYKKFITKNNYVINNNSITVKSEGKFLTDFEINRAGFNILLPLKNVVGEKLSILDYNNKKFKSNFPTLISPDQPFIDISEVNYSMNNIIKLNFKFEGIKFEMEDQRNWGDASYKIYSGSLLDPFPYLIKKNTNFFQQIKINFKKIKVFKKLKKPKIFYLVIQKKINFSAPNIGIKLDSFNYKKLHKNDLNFNFILKEFDLTDFNIDTFNFKEIDKNINLFAIFIVDHKKPVSKVISEIVNISKKITCKIPYILICPKIYLSSHQPAGKWPKVPLLSEYNKRIKSKFENSKIVSGMVTNFTELNRKKPVKDYELMSFSFTPIVHDASDHGVLETPETVDHIIKTLKKINHECDIHVGPISLGMHHNPYGQKLVKNSKKTRTEMTNQDLRHDSLFSLVWSVGMYQELSKHNIKLLTFNNLLGYHGIYEKNFNKRPLYIFNKIITEFSGKDLYLLNRDPNFFSICVLDGNTYKVLISNKTKVTQTVVLPKCYSIKSSYINNKNFNYLLQNMNSFFKLKKVNNKLDFLPYETKYLEIIK